MIRIKNAIATSLFLLLATATFATPQTVEGEVTTNSLGMNLRLIQPGKFLMGSPASEKDRADSETQHEVVLTKPFYMGVTEVTQAQFEEVMGIMGANPTKWKGANLPVVQVSWEDAVTFCEKLSVRDPNLTYRLPTEAQWQYACRAGTTTRFYWGDDPDYSQSDQFAVYMTNSGKQANDVGPKNPNLWKLYDNRGNARAFHTLNSGYQTSEVGQRKPNAWGLYDMSGNVHEWCADWYGDYPSGRQTDPAGAPDGKRRVISGGSWYVSASLCRSASRAQSWIGMRSLSVGFRVIAVPAGSLSDQSASISLNSGVTVPASPLEPGVAVQIQLPALPPGRDVWTSSRHSVAKDRDIHLRASGEIKLHSSKAPNGPAGYMSRISGAPFLVPGNQSGALVGKIGKEGTPFLIGKELRLKTKTAGTLFLAVNDRISHHYDNSGHFIVDLVDGELPPAPVPSAGGTAAMKDSLKVTFLEELAAEIAKSISK